MYNPYVTPSSAVFGSDTEGRTNFQEYTTQELKTLLGFSSNIRAVGIFWSLGILGMLVLAYFSPFASPRQSSLLTTACLMLPLAGGCFARPAWAQTIGILACGLSLLGFPLGTLIGVLGIRSFFKGSVLFGEGRFRHADLRFEYRHRKANGIA